MTRQIGGVDCHAHVFERGLALAPDRRYAPHYDATFGDYLAMLDANAMSHGVLVQPSFLGLDNSYLLATLATLAHAPDRLRGIAVVDPHSSTEERASLAAAGIIGIRHAALAAPSGRHRRTWLAGRDSCRSRAFARAACTVM